MSDNEIIDSIIDLSNNGEIKRVKTNYVAMDYMNQVITKFNFLKKKDVKKDVILEEEYFKMAKLGEIDVYLDPDMFISDTSIKDFDDNEIVDLKKIIEYETDFIS